MTNYEKIKSLPIDEMAVHIERLDPYLLSEKFCVRKTECEAIELIEESECVKCVIAWLESECDK